MKRIHNQARNIFTFDDEFYERKTEGADDMAPAPAIASNTKESKTTQHLLRVLGAAISYLSAKMGENETRGAGAHDIYSDDYSNDPGLPPLFDESDNDRPADSVETSLKILDDLAETVLNPDSAPRPSLFFKAFKD